MAESFVVYIDEAGDTGFSFPDGEERGSSEWLCLSAVVVRKENDLKLVETGKRIRHVLGWKKDRFFHFRDMRHKPRRVMLKNLVSKDCPVRCVSVVCHKPSIILEAERFQYRDRLYFYITRMLIERVSWLCRDHHIDGQGDGRARLIFSHRRRMSYSSLREYLLRLKKDDGVRIDWGVVDPQIVQALGSRELVGLQFADAVASSFFTGLSLSGYGLTEPQYAISLKPIVYKHRGQYLGYGVKLYPPEIQRSLPSKSEAAWLLKEFK